jgi:hypothetical protein
MESRFGHDFGRVRVHTDAKAAESAQAVDALAYTAGCDVVFAAGHYRPRTPEGQALMAHELAHVVQQGTAPSRMTDLLPISHRSDPTELEADRVTQKIIGGGSGLVRIGAPVHVARQPTDENSGLVDRAKATLYRGVIAALRGSQRTLISGLRRAARQLPEGARSIIDNIIDIVEGVTDVIVSLHLAIIAVNVGLVSGLVGLVEGVFRMAAGLLTGIALFIAGLATGDMGAAKLWLEDLYRAIVGLPEAIKALYQRWVAEFETASTDRQTIMIGELTGQIIALLVPFLLSGGAAAGGRAGTVAEVSTSAARTGTAVARPSLTLLQGGGETASVTTGPARAAPLFRGTNALKVAPETLPEVAPVVRSVPQPVPTPPAAAPVAATSSSRAVRTAAGVGASTAARLAQGQEESKSPGRQNSMRFQVQWGTRQGGPTFSQVALAPSNPGVTTVQAVAALNDTLALVRPAAAQSAAAPAALQQEAWITTRPPAGIAQGGYSRSEYFPYGRYTDARVDVENLRGHNLRV